MPTLPSDTCEDCGGRVITGVEGTGHDRVVHESDWCTNLDCPSNYARKPFHRLGVGSLKCRICHDIIVGPIREAQAHAMGHGEEYLVMLRGE